MKLLLVTVSVFLLCQGRPQVEEPEEMAGCDPDFGWLNGADGSGKCYRLIRTADYTSCGVDNFESGMSWFSAMECCYFNKDTWLNPPTSRSKTRLWSTSQQLMECL